MGRLISWDTAKVEGPVYLKEDVDKVIVKLEKQLKILSIISGVFTDYEEGLTSMGHLIEEVSCHIDNYRSLKKDSF